MKIAPAITMVLGLACCQSGSSYEREMASIAALKVAVDSALAQTTRIDTATIRSAENKWRTNLLQLANKAKAQTDSSLILSEEVLIRYREKIADAAWALDHTEILQRELKLTKEQLDNLYHDLSYNLLDARDVKEAYRMECASADSAISRANRLASMAVNTGILPADLALKIDSALEYMKIN